MGKFALNLVISILFILIILIIMYIPYKNNIKKNSKKLFLKSIAFSPIYYFFLCSSFIFTLIGIFDSLDNSSFIFIIPKLLIAICMYYVGIMESTLYFFEDALFVNFNDYIPYHAINKIEFQKCKNPQKYRIIISFKKENFEYKIKASEKEEITKLFSSLLPNHLIIK